MLKIEGLHVSVDGKPIVNGLNLEVNKGEVHAIMGPNGSGKSTLAYALAGRMDLDLETEGAFQANHPDLPIRPSNEAANRVHDRGRVEVPAVDRDSPGAGALVPRQ